MEDLSAFLYDIDQELQRRGHPPMDDDTLRYTATRMTHPLVREKLRNDEWTVEDLVNEVEEGLRGVRREPRSGRGDELLDPNNAKSRIEGDVGLALAASKIHALPGDPRDQTVQNPMANFREQTPRPMMDL